MVVVGEVSEKGGGEKRRVRQKDDTEKSKCTARSYRFRFMFCGDFLKRLHLQGHSV